MNFRSTAAALGAAAVLSTWFTLTGAGPVLGHANLVSSDPGAGSVVDVSPAEIRLVFSEQIEPRGTSADVLDAVGHAIVVTGGQPDPTDAYTLVVPVPALADGAYTVQWRSLSAADGHVAQGFFTFAVGAGSSPPPINNQTGGGDIHAGHDATTALVETNGRAAGDAGAMLLFGLALIGLIVVLPLAPQLSRGLFLAIAGAAELGAVGALLLGLSAGDAAGLSVPDYFFDTRSGLVLVVRAVLFAVAGVAVLAIARRSARGAALTATALGLAAVTLLAASGHASAFTSPLPIVAMAVHVSAAGTWLAGLLVLAAIALHARLRPAEAAALPPLSTFVPRFSALALVAAALFGLTGLAFAGELAGGILVLNSPYGSLVVLKIGLALGALGLGAFNFLGRRHPDGRSGALAWRIPLEAGVACAIVVVSALLASGTPPAPLQPLPLAPSGATTAAGIGLAIEPGRPGPQRFVATITGPSASSASSVVLELQRVDIAQGISRVPMRADPASANEWISDGGLLLANTSWTATVISIDASGTQTARQRFDMVFDANHLVSGGADTGISLAVLCGLALLALAILGFTLALAGVAPPRTPQRLGRLALLAGSAIAGPLGLVLVFAWTH